MLSDESSSKQGSRHLSEENLINKIKIYHPNTFHKLKVIFRNLMVFSISNRVTSIQTLGVFRYIIIDFHV